MTKRWPLLATDAFVIGVVVLATGLWVGNLRDDAAAFTKDEAADQCIAAMMGELREKHPRGNIGVGFTSSKPSTNEGQQGWKFEMLGTVDATDFTSSCEIFGSPDSNSVLLTEPRQT